MIEEDLERVRMARERAREQAQAFFGSLSPEQLEILESAADKSDGPTPVTFDHEEIGANYEASGWMSKADYLEMERVIGAFQAGLPTTEPDFAMMLGFLGESRQAIIRARILTFLGELMKRQATGTDRVARIEEAIAPWREGPEDLDILYWAFVRDALDARLS